MLISVPRRSTAYPVGLQLGNLPVHDSFESCDRRTRRLKRYMYKTLGTRACAMLSTTTSLSPCMHTYVTAVLVVQTKKWIALLPWSKHAWVVDVTASGCG